MVGRHADRDLAIRFGIPAIVAAFIDTAMLGHFSGFREVATYSLGSRTAVITPIKLLMGALMLFFALFELLPTLRKAFFSAMPTGTIKMGDHLTRHSGGQSLSAGSRVR